MLFERISCEESNCNQHLLHTIIRILMHLSQIEKCICLKLQTVFVSNCKLYLSQIENCICLKLQNVFVSEYRYLLSTKGIHTAYANCKLYLSQASHIGRAAKLSDWSACFWLQVICPQQSDMYIYREQLVGPICSTFSLPFHNWKFGRFFLIFRCNLKVAPTVCYIQRKHGVESHLQFRRRVNLKILQIPGLRHA